MIKERDKINRKKVLDVCCVVSSFMTATEIVLETVVEL